MNLLVPFVSVGSGFVSGLLYCEGGLSLVFFMLLSYELKALWPPGFVPHITSADLNYFPACYDVGWKVVFRACMLRSCTPES